MKRSIPKKAFPWVMAIDDSIIEDDWFGATRARYFAITIYRLKIKG